MLLIAALPPHRWLPRAVVQGIKLLLNAAAEEFHAWRGGRRVGAHPPGSSPCADHDLELGGAVLTQRKGAEMTAHTLPTVVVVQPDGKHLGLAVEDGGGPGSKVHNTAGEEVEDSESASDDGSDQRRWQ